MNKISNFPSMQEVCSIYGSLMHTSVDYPYFGKSDSVTEQVNAT